MFPTTSLETTKESSKTSPKLKVRFLIKFSQQISPPPNDTDPDIKDPPAPDINDIEISVNGVHKLMTNLDPSKATGPDNIPPFLLKEYADQWAPVFQILFQASLNQGIVPADWKKAYITPIFKKGDPLQANNYRPVSLTSIPCKLLEHIIHSHFMSHHKQHKILCDNQHGFRKFRSCESQLIAVVDDLARNIDVGNQTDLILLDFSKAFDKVNHKSLLKKVRHYGMRNHVYNWLESFLTNRSQQVQIDGSLSEPADVLSGVPQGTVLGPLLFLLYINDLPKYVSTGTEVRLFADDSALYRTIKSPQDHIILQNDLDSLQKWEQEWSMHFHPQKCQLLRVTTSHSPSMYTYNIHSIDIEPTQDAKYLGVTLHNKLSWNTHIDIIAQKANRTLNFIRRNFKSCNSNIKNRLYTTYVRPSVEFCSSAWDPQTTLNIDKLERVQKRAARFVTGDYRRDQSVTEMMRRLGWTPLRERRARAKAVTVYKATHDMIDIPFKNLPTIQNGLRNADDYFIPFAHKNVYFNSFYPNTIRLWNDLHDWIKESSSLSDFEGAIRGHTIICHY